MSLILYGFSQQMFSMQKKLANKVIYMYDIYRLGGPDGAEPARGGGHFKGEGTAFPHPDRLCQ